MAPFFWSQPRCQKIGLIRFIFNLYVSQNRLMGDRLSLTVQLDLILLVVVLFLVLLALIDTCDYGYEENYQIEAQAGEVALEEVVAEEDDEEEDC